MKLDEAKRLELAITDAAKTLNLAIISASLRGLATEIDTDAVSTMDLGTYYTVRVSAKISPDALEA